VADGFTIGHLGEFEQNGRWQLVRRGLDVASFGLFVSFAYVPWVLRLRDLLGVELPAHVASWLDALCARPSVRAEAEVVAAL